MCQHAQLCKPMPAGNDDDDREDSLPDYEDGDNGNKDDESVFRGLTHPTDSTSPAVVANSSPYIGVHTRAGFPCQALLVIKP